MNMKRVLVALVSLFAAAGCNSGSAGIGTVVGGAPVAMEVYKDAACGCCAQWVEHVKDHGFAATATDVSDLDAVKVKYNVPRRLQSCHTAIVEGYVVEGHVPAADIHRLLKERPAIVGIAVPAMPVGSPGMEVPGIQPQPYDVLALHKDGRTEVFSSYNK
jgi:hypothetical protein